LTKAAVTRMCVCEGRADAEDRDVPHVSAESGALSCCLYR
jgi:hypothetical protein